jgi:hypothetical protein
LTANEENEMLAGLVLKWVKEKYPERYKQTLAVASIPATFRQYLVRLLEIRWEEDGDIHAEWKREVPMWALEETKVRVKARLDDGTEIEIAGKKVEGRTWAFAEIGMVLSEPDRERRKEMVRGLAALKIAGDLRVVEVGKK